MATHRLPILPWALRVTNLDSSPNYPALTTFDTSATNDVWKRLAYLFSDNATSDMVLVGGFVVPKNYVGGGAFVIVWTTTVIVGSVSWRVNYRTVAGDNTTSLDQTSEEEVLGSVPVVAATTLDRLETTLTATAADFAADEEVEYNLVRRSNSHVLDTAAGDAILFNLLFEYTDA